jgi:hypothetical protein
VLRRFLVLSLPILGASIADGAPRHGAPADAVAVESAPCTLPVAWDMAPSHATDPALPAAGAARADDPPPPFRMLPRTCRAFHVARPGLPVHRVRPGAAATVLPDLTGTRTGVPVFSHTAPPPIR